MTLSTLDIDHIELEQIDDGATSEFNSFEIDRAKRTMDEFEADDIWVVGSFSDDIWAFEDKDLRVGSRVIFDFSKLEPVVLQSKLKLDLKSVVKCWVVQLLESYRLRVVQRHYSRLIWVLESSNGFNRNHAEAFKKSFMNITNESTRASYITTAMNFIDYTQFEEMSVYIPTLLEIRSSTTVRVFARTLPPSQDVLRFSFFLEKYFSELKDSVEDGNNKILYYPLLIWWKLTTIIPLRASEFCIMARNCLVVDNSKAHLKLPRTKSPKNVQVYDRVLINSQMLQLINEYFSLTEKLGETKTLISYRSIRAAHESLGSIGNQGRGYLKLNSDYFSINILRQLIHRFYFEILEKKYNVSIEKSNWVRPNDTRHIAFISLMMQGISPVEIARLGGHTTIQSQYHYSRHVEYWIDTSVNKLLGKYKHTLSAQDHSGGGYIPRDIVLATVKPGTTDSVLPLEIGYCSDSQQRCETDVLGVRGCMFGCSHWRITKQELREKRETVKELIVTKKKKIHELFTFMKSLHEQILKDEFKGKSIDFQTRLKTTAKQIEHEIEDLAKFGANTFVGGSIQYEQ